MRRVDLLEMIALVDLLVMTIALHQMMLINVQEKKRPQMNALRTATVTMMSATPAAMLTHAMKMQMKRLINVSRGKQQTIPALRKMYALMVVHLMTVPRMAPLRTETNVREVTTRLTLVSQRDLGQVVGISVQ